MSYFSKLSVGFLILALVLGGFALPASATSTPVLTAIINTPNNGSNVIIYGTTAFSASAIGGTAPYVYGWNFGDGTNGLGASFNKIYTQAGAKIATLTVTDFAGNQAITTINLTVTGQSSLSANITTPANNATLLVNTPVIFTGSATGGTAPYTFSWNFGDSTSGSGASFSKIYIATGNKVVTLTVTDFSGSTATKVINVLVDSGNPSDTTPPTTPTITTSTHQPNNPSATTTVGVNWSVSTDNVGLAGYSFLWDNAAATIPDNTVDSTANSLNQTLTPGTWYFHIKAIDTAGNSSGTTHYGPIVITSNTGDPLTITNIQVTDITQTGATIRWTTNRPANSRVIYDTVSHPDISSQTGPNYGYANSTATFDDSPKVTTHAVPVTGLAVNTAYFFRVLSQE